MIDFNLIEKKYDNNFTLENVNINLCKGNCIGLIGPNGSGKTTFINCLLGFTEFSGNLNYNNKKICIRDDYESFYLFRDNVAYISDETTLFNFLTPDEYFNLLKNNSAKIIEKDFYDSILKIFKINEYRNVKISNLSFGTKKKLQIVFQIIKKPKFIIFDEPTNGLDPEMIIILKSLIKKLLNDGVGVLLSTHQLSFCKDISTYIIILQDGKCILKSSADELYSKYKTNSLEEIYKDINSKFYEKVGELIEDIKY